MGSAQEPKPMTPDELHSFEEEVVQHDDDRRDGGPASEPDVNDDRKQLERRGIIPPTPD